MNYDKQFISVFNTYYPFERYIMQSPKQLNYYFDDVFVTEIFIPNTEIKPIVGPRSGIITWTKVDDDEIYIKVKGPAGTMRFGYFDFAEHKRETIREAVRRDFGVEEWERLYEDYEDGDAPLKEVLLKQKSLIESLYGVCKIKDTASTKLIIN